MKTLKKLLIMLTVFAANQYVVASEVGQENVNPQFGNGTFLKRFQAMKQSGQGGNLLKKLQESGQADQLRTRLMAMKQSGQGGELLQRLQAMKQSGQLPAQPTQTTVSEVTQTTVTEQPLQQVAAQPTQTAVQTTQNPVERNATTSSTQALASIYQLAQNSIDLNNTQSLDANFAQMKELANNLDATQKPQVLAAVDTMQDLITTYKTSGTWGAMGKVSAAQAVGPTLGFKTGDGRILLQKADKEKAAGRS